MKFLLFCHFGPVRIEFRACVEKDSDFKTFLYNDLRMNGLTQESIPKNVFEITVPMALISHAMGRKERADYRWKNVSK